MAINIRIILQPPLDSLVGNAKDQQEIGDNRTVYGDFLDVLWDCLRTGPRICSRLC